ncbi:hypothetical protein BO79DRAFT_235054 [Aspergillus costaricaensis CBS 115574]|uniref:Uncharacterized protein n=1 Tax=Aspergillus costaricaensis CBS 115574 TaxID=1448317 RepID=A0ACD1IRF5_9EURO|nr:hypothetical protein BO79DRAFT_235054 [Aspergillus costaricaensis CBS 115574]RAK93199.1 hypothetical protein BO79DRAFT_235054 [Aspergillus costaricaensis CBS 115574]
MLVLGLVRSHCRGKRPTTMPFLFKNPLEPLEAIDFTLLSARIYCEAGRGSSLLAAGCNITDVRLARGPAQKLLSLRPTAESLHANGLLLPQWGSCAAHDGWRSRTSAGDPTGKPIFARACLRACCVSSLMPLVIGTILPPSIIHRDHSWDSHDDGYAVHHDAGTLLDHVPFHHAAPDHLIVDRQAGISRGSYRSNRFTQFISARAAQCEQTAEYHYFSIYMAHMKAVKHGSVGELYLRWKSGRHVRCRCHIGQAHSH